MFYQFVMFISTVLGPATVLMMIAGAFNSVLGTNLWQSYVLAVGPAAFYILICFTTKANTQIQVAAFMSAGYAVIMMIVIVGTVINATMESFTSPNVIFLTTLVGFYIFAAIFHPQEFFCVAPGALYFMCIPSGYLLLIIYSLTNLHVVSWGTREVAAKKTKAELKKEKQEALKKQQEQKEQKGGLLGWLGISKFIEDLKEFYKQMTGGSSKSPQDETNLLLMELLQTMKHESGPGKEPVKKRNELREMIEAKKNNAKKSPDTVIQIPDETVESESESEDERPKRKKIRDDLKNPAWIEDTDIGNGPKKNLDKRELSFWKQMIRQHLLPLSKDSEKEKKIQNDLKGMRTSVVFAFTMMNVLWIVLVFQLQLLKEELKDDFFIPIPRADDPDYCERFEPLGLAFLALFGVVLLLQFIAMMAHRWSTFLQIISITKLHMPWTTKKSPSEDLEEALRLIRELQTAKDLPEVDYLQTSETENSSNDKSKGTEDERRDKRRDRDPSERRRRRRDRGRSRHVGMRHLGGETLSRNFRRRLDALNHANDGRVYPNDPRNTRRPTDSFEKRQMYRTVRDRYHHQRNDYYKQQRRQKFREYPQRSTSPYHYNDYNHYNPRYY